MCLFSFAFKALFWLFVEFLKHKKVVGQRMLEQAIENFLLKVANNWWLKYELEIKPKPVLELMLRKQNSAGSSSYKKEYRAKNYELIYCSMKAKIETFFRIFFLDHRLSLAQY